MIPASALCCVSTCHSPATWLHARLGVGLCVGHFGPAHEALEGIWRRVQDHPLPAASSSLTHPAIIEQDASQALQDRR